jgi:hypothetical protein
MSITLKKQIKTNDKPWSPVKLICIRLKLKEKLDLKKKALCKCTVTCEFVRRWTLISSYLLVFFFFFLIYKILMLIAEPKIGIC